MCIRIEPFASSGSEKPAIKARGMPIGSMGLCGLRKRKKKERSEDEIERRSRGTVSRGPLSICASRLRGLVFGPACVSPPERSFDRLLNICTGCPL